MTAKWLKISVVAVAATLSGFAVNASAATQALMGFDVNGAAVSSGWVASWSDAYGNVNLTFRGVSGNNFYFEKEATLTPPAGNGIDGLEILFTKVDPNAKSLVINDEIITNKTGVDWTGFSWILASQHTGGTSTSLGTPSFAFTTDNGSGGIGDFRIDPFTSFNFADSGAVLNFTGGTVKNGETWFAGAKSATGIAIVANGQSDSFVLKEVPTGTAIPLPAAAWTGMSTLLGLGLLAAAKNARKLLA
jgi:hypothetical protein